MVRDYVTRNISTFVSFFLPTNVYFNVNGTGALLENFSMFAG